MDNGEAVGLQANDYIYEHHKRNIPKPKIMSAEARRLRSDPDFKTKSERMALIKNDEGNEVLCYEFIGRINGGMISNIHKCRFWFRGIN